MISYEQIWPSIAIVVGDRDAAWMKGNWRA